MTKVHWIIDRSLERNERYGYATLVEALEQNGSPFTLVRKIPFTDYLIDIDDQGPEPTPITLNIEGPVFISGTTSMRLVADNHGWSPGYITAPSQTELVDHWGENVLNHDAVFGSLREIEPPTGDFFARPVEDSKAFSGEIMSREHFLDWRRDVVKGENAFVTLKADDQVMLAPLKRIYAEYRLFVIGGQIVTGSRYKLGSRVFYTQDLDSSMLSYARDRIGEYCPRDALCLDIAHVEGDQPYKVIETNSISSAGFYACDMGAYVRAIDAIYGE